MILVLTCFCVCICLIFRFVYLAYYCFCAMLLQRLYYNTLSLSTLYEEVLLTKTTIYAPEKLSTLGKRFIYTMEKIDFGYSMKNIGIPQNKIYLLHLIEKIEMVIKTMRCRVLCNDKKETNGIKTQWYGLKSSKRLKEVKNSYLLTMILLCQYRTSD